MNSGKMTFEEKKKNLEAIIHRDLLPLIDHDYILLDLPYHSNIGDILIWEGERSFLKNAPHSCIYGSSRDTYKKQALPEDRIVLIHGGGNWGDVWRERHLFHLEIIRDYPENKIVVFPQTVYYSDIGNLKYDASVENAHKDLTICARDERSYRLLKEHHPNNKILLIPDMAFCIPQEYLSGLASSMVRKQKKNLYFKRTDKELTDFDINNYTRNYEIKDWPTTRPGSLTDISSRLLFKGCRLKIAPKFAVDHYADRIFRKRCLKIGVRFLEKYSEIYTTRLHGAILSTLLNIPFSLINNSYGKNKDFFNTWFKDMDNARFLSE